MSSHKRNQVNHCTHVEFNSTLHIQYYKCMRNKVTLTNFEQGIQGMSSTLFKSGRGLFIRSNPSVRFYFKFILFKPFIKFCTRNKTLQTLQISKHIVPNFSTVVFDAIYQTQRVCFVEVTEWSSYSGLVYNALPHPLDWVEFRVELR